MSDIPDEERCIALKRSGGGRCTRMAKDGQFCFQHDESFETVSTQGEEEPDNFIEVVSNRIEVDADSLSGTRKDVAQNVKDILESASSLSDAFRSGRLSRVGDAFHQAVGKTGPTAGAGALIGGVAGSPFGPVGIATGATVGSWFGVYKSIDDDRALAASVVEEVPEGAEVVSSQTDPIADVEPIQMAIKSAQNEQDETEWLRSTATRERDMDEVSDALDQIPEYHGADDERRYYVRDQETGEVLLLIFGVPQ